MNHRAMAWKRPQRTLHALGGDDEEDSASECANLAIDIFRLSLRYVYRTSSMFACDQLSPAV